MVLSLDDGCRGGLFAPTTNEAQSDPHRVALHRAPHIAPVDVGQPHLDAVAQRIAAQRIDRVESHRLIIEQGDVVLDRVIVSEPCRLIREQAERRGMRLGESEFAERDHLAEDFLRRGFGDAAGDGAGPKFFPEARNQIVRATAAHRAAQRFGLPGRESRERLAHLQYLILIENDAERFGEAFAEQGMVHGRLVWPAGRVGAALFFPPPDVWVHGPPDDRPRSHDRDFDREVFQVPRPAAPDHLDLRATLDLKQADRVAGADAVVDRGVLEIDA